MCKLATLLRAISGRGELSVLAFVGLLHLSFLSSEQSTKSFCQEPSQAFPMMMNITVAAFQGTSAMAVSRNLP